MKRFCGSQNQPLLFTKTHIFQSMDQSVDYWEKVSGTVQATEHSVQATEHS
ncbi:MAG: hypothetical protein V1649_03875 [Patescibacteria group bacterium]